MGNKTEGMCADFVEFERIQKETLPETAFSTAKAIKDIVAGYKLVTPTSGNGIFKITKKYARWTLYPPGFFNDQQPDHWRLTVEALNDELGHIVPNQQELEENLQCIAEILRMHY